MTGVIFAPCDGRGAGRVLTGQLSLPNAKMNICDPRELAMFATSLNKAHAFCTV